MPRRLHAILFDLDGTLIDSIELILCSYEHTLEAHGKPPVDRPSLLSFVGVPLRNHLSHYSDDAAEIDAMIRTYRSWNHDNHDRLVRPFDGIDALLDALQARDVPIGVVTSKMHDAARRGLQHCGIASHFELLIGADDVEKHKPDPTPVLEGCRRLGVEPSATAYVGDSVHDMAAAVAAGCVALGAGWGPFDHRDLVASGADPVLARPADVVVAAGLESHA